MSLLIESIDDETASRYYNEIDTASGEELANRVAALKKWADAKEADTRRQNWDHISGVFTNFDAYAASEGLTDFDEESRFQYANRKFVADQTGETPQDQMLLYPSKRDEVTDRLAGKTGLSEKETFDLFKGFVESRNATEAAIRELPGVLAQGVLARAAEGKPFDEVDSWNAFSAWKDRHADKLAGLPDGWESAMLDSAVRLHTRTEQLMDDVAPESKRAMDILLKFTRPEDAANLPEADRTEVAGLAKEFAKLTPEQREGIYSTLFYAAEAGGAGMGKGFFEKVGEGLARGGTNIYDDAAITAEDRNARENLKRLRSGEPVYLGPNNLVRREDEFFQIGAAEQGAPLGETAPAGTPLAEGQIASLIESNEQRLKELRVQRELRDIAQGAIDPIKAEMDGVLGSVVQGAYDFSQSAAYTGLAMIPYVGLPAVMGALANSNYLRMIDQYPDMDADAAWTMSLAIAGPQAVVERFQANALIGRSPMLNALMRRMTDVRLPIPVRLGIGYGANVAFQTGQEFVQEAMPVIADQIAAAIREDMPQFDAKKAWGSYLDQGPEIFYSMLWAGLIGTGASTFRELKRNGQFERSLEELEMVGITGEAAQDIAAEQDPDAATAKFREAWNNRKPGDIQAGIRKRAAQLEAAQQQQPDQELPSRRVVENPDGTTTHIIEKGDGTAIYRTNDPVAADMALVNITRMMQRGRITDTTTGIVESLQFIDQVNQSLARGEDVQQLLIEGAPRTLLDEYEANPTQQNLDNLFSTVRAFGQEINEPAELAQYPVLASNRGALAEGIYKSVIRIQDGATGVEVMRDFSQDNLKRALAENRITLDWVREQLNQVIPLIESDRLEGRRLRTETDTDVIESFSDVAVAYMTGRIRDEQIPGGLRGFLRRIAIVVRDIFRRAYRLNRAIAEGKVDASFESLLAESVGLDQQAIVDITRDRIGNEVLADTNFSIAASDTRLRGININDSEQDFTGQILLGEKTIETRDAPTLSPYIGRRVALVSTGKGGKPSIVGYAVVGEPRIYNSVEEFRADYDQHRVEPDSTFDIKSPGIKYGYPLTNIESVEPTPVNVPVGRVATILDSAANYSIGITVAPLRKDSLSELSAKEMQKRAASAKYIHLQQIATDVATAYGVKILSRQPVIGGWVEGGYMSLEVPEAMIADTDDIEIAEEMGAIIGASAPELQNAVLLWRDDINGKDTILKFKAKGTSAAMAVAQDLNAAGLNGFSYDTKTREFSLVLVGLERDAVDKVYEYLDDQSKTGNISSGRGVEARAGSAKFPSEGDYRGYLQRARDRAVGFEAGRSEALLDVVDRAERRLDRYEKGKKISAKAQRALKKLQPPNTSASAIETELKGRQFDNIRQLGLFLDSRFVRLHGKPTFEIGGQEGVDSASDALVYDLLDGLSKDGSGMGWYDERVQETIRELSKLHPEFATDPLALAVYTAILATTSQGYTVVENFKQANRVYKEYKRTGRIPNDLKFAKSSDPINSNLAQIQGLIDQFGLNGFAAFMDEEVTGQALRDQFGRQPTGVTLQDTVRGNRVLGPKIGSFFNNLRGRFDTITMDLWYTRTMHRYLGETVVPLNSDKMQNAITKFRAELQKEGVRTYGLDIAEALKDDESTVQAALTLFQRWARGGNQYTDNGYFKFPDGYAIEKAARRIFSSGGMKGAPQNKTHRQYFAKIVLEAKAKLKALGFNLTEADMQAIIWYREKNLFARTGVANAAAKPADYLDAVMVARSGAQVQEEADLADIDEEELQTDGKADFSIATPRDIQRVSRAFDAAARSPDERIAIFERAKGRFFSVLAENQKALDDLRGGTLSFRRTQLLQALGELDAILSVFPPDIRGRVGGYTKLASIAPHDVFDPDNIKIAEVSGMKGAIISAWMRTGLNIGEANKKTELPPGFTAKENLSTARADRAIAEFFRDRIAKVDLELEKHLSREYRTAILAEVKKSRPKAGDNNVRKSTLGAEVQAFADLVHKATLMDEDTAIKRLAELEAALIDPELDNDPNADSKRSDLSEEWNIVNTFGYLKGRTSDTLAYGLSWLKEQLQGGRESWRIKEQARIEEGRARVAAVLDWVGKGTAKKRFADKTFLSRIADTGNAYLLDHASFEQFVNALLPPDIAAYFSDRLRKADIATQREELQTRDIIMDAVKRGAAAANMKPGEAMLWLKAEQANAVHYLEDRMVKNVELTIEQAEKILRGEIDRSDLTNADVRNLEDELLALPADTKKEKITLKKVVFRGNDVRLSMSRGKAIQLLLSWNQPDVQEKMRREGWTDESAANLRDLTADPVSQEVMAAMQKFYAGGSDVVNPVYARMFGMNIPQVRNYAPTRFLHSRDVRDVGLDGAPQVNSTIPGFAKGRVTHSAKIAPEDALGVMLQHSLVQSHWVHFAELAREFRSLLSSPNIREAIKQAHGDGVLQTAELWADQMEQRGGNKAREHAWLNNVLGAIVSGKSIASLAFNLKTLIMQMDSALRFTLALDPKQVASAMSDPPGLVKDIETVWSSDTLQNRLRGGATAEARFLFQRYAGKPGVGAKISEVGMNIINWLDSAATSFSAAIVYRAAYNDAIQSMPEGAAREAALTAAEQSIYRFAQPTSFGQKSTVENNGNILTKVFFLFMSDPRLKTSIIADAARGLATGRGNASEHIRKIVAIELMAVMSHVVAGIYRDLFSDDEDEEIWSLGGFARAILLAPFQGFFFAGTVADLTLSKLTDAKWFTPTQNPLLDTVQTTFRAINNAEDAIAFDDPDALLKEWAAIFRALAVNPAMAAPAAILNILKPVAGLAQNIENNE